MPIQIYDIDHGIGFWYYAQGKLTGSELIANKKIGAKYIHKLDYWLLDFIDITDVEISDSELQQIVAEDLHQSFINPDVVFAVAADSDYAYGMVRMWMGHIGQLPWKIELFRSREQALGWLRDRGFNPQLSRCQPKSDPASPSSDS
jgi:hypothetical protein